MKLQFPLNILVLVNSIHLLAQAHSEIAGQIVLDSADTVVFDRKKAEVILAADINNDEQIDTIFKTLYWKKAKLTEHRVQYSAVM